MSSLFRTLFNSTVARHKKLSEDQGIGGDDLIEQDGVTFCCKYLGASLVADPKGEAGTAEAIAHIIAKAKTHNQKPAKVMFKVSRQGIQIDHSDTNETLIKTSIYKISYCSADAHYDHVFAFIATNDKDELECHAFLCPKRKIAQDVTIAIAQSFNSAYEYWKNRIENNEPKFSPSVQESRFVDSLERSSPNSSSSETYTISTSPAPCQSESDFSTSGYCSNTPTQLIDFDDSSKDTSPLPQCLNNIKKKWAQFDDYTNDIEDEFSKLDVTENSSAYKNSSLDYLSQGNLTNPSPCQSTPLSSNLKSTLAQPTTNLIDGDFLTGFSTNTQQATPTPIPIASSLGQTNKRLEHSSSIDNSWENFGTSPNSSFLDGCQSPTFVNEETNTSVKTSSFFDVTLSSEAPANTPANASTLLAPQSENLFTFPTDQTSKDASRNAWQLFTEDTNASTNANPQSPNSCGILQSLWSGSFASGKENKLICS